MKDQKTRARAPVPPLPDDVPDVNIVLVGLNARHFVLDCLGSIRDATWRAVRWHAVYVDNGSSDGSADAVREAHPWATVIANPENLGYCPAANQGARRVPARHYYFINDDTLVRDDAIARTVELMDADPSIGTVGSRLIYPDGEEQYSGRAFPSMWNAIFSRRSPLSRMFPDLPVVKRYLHTEDLARGEPFEVDWVSAAGQIVSHETFWAVGGYAEDYYYWHESVFCHRIHQYGKRVVLDPGSVVVHYEGKGSGPRPPAVQRFHIVNFHHGAWRCYCECNDLGDLHPMRWIVGALLWSRAALLWSGTFLRPRTR